MRTINVPKAKYIRDNKGEEIEAVTIVIDDHAECIPPLNADYAVLDKYFDDHVKTLAEAMVSTLPLDITDRLGMELLLRSRSYDITTISVKGSNQYE